MKIAQRNSYSLTGKISIKIKRLFVLPLIAIIALSFTLTACNFEKTITYDVMFNSNGGSIVNPQTAEEGGSVSKPADPTKAGCNFAGWYDNSGLSGNAVIFPYAPSKSITLYAKWSEKIETQELAVKHTVTYICNGGSGVSGQTVEKGGSVSKPADPTKALNDFAGWYDNFELYGNPVVFPYTPTENIALYAKWTENSTEAQSEPTVRFTVAFDSNDGSVIASQTVENSGGVSKPADPEKAGNDFAGWYDNSGLSGNTVVFPYAPMENITLYAKWTEASQLAAQCTVTFDPCGGRYTASQTVIEGGRVASPAVPTKDEHVFAGWYDNSGLSGSAVVFPYAPAADITLYAKWTETSPSAAAQYTVTFDSSDGIYVSSQTVEEGGSVSKPATSADTENDNTDWYDNSALSGNAVVFPYTPTASITLYAEAALFTSESSFEYSISGGEVKITGYIGSETDVSIPGTIQGLPVTSIGYIAFYNRSSLTSIEIPDSVTTIGDYAFAYCASLASVIIPESVTNVGAYTFADCTGLTSVTISEGATSIGAYTFYGCTGLGNVTIPSSVTGIGAYSFYNCSNLAIVTIGANVQSIGDRAFYGCSILASVTIPNSVTSIGAYAFYGCSTLGNVIIQGSITSIGNYTFAYCDNLISVTIPGSVASIGSYAFYYCGNLSSITIPGGVSSIGDSAFRYCIRLGNITIPDSVTNIGAYIFANCASLASVTISNSIASIGSFAFYGCDGLTSVTIPGSVTSIGSYAFSSCGSLASITIPDNVTNIGNYAFSSCANITSVTIGSRVTGIGNYAFADCARLTSVTIPDSVTSIGYAAFNGCIGLTSISLPFVGASLNGTSNTHFGYIFGASAYSGHSLSYIPANLKTVNLTGGASIGDYAFYNCANITSVTIPNSVTSIGRSAFNNTGIWNSAANNSVVYISNWAVGVKGTISGSITLNSGTKGIAGYAFNWCTELTSLTIPDSVKSIGSYAFSYCSSLTVYLAAASSTGITLGSNWNNNSRPVYYGITSNTFTTINNIHYYLNGSTVTVTGGEAAITSAGIADTVTFNGSAYNVTSIGDYAFENFAGLASVTIPNSVTSIGRSAFSNTGIWNSAANNSVIYIGNWAVGVKGIISGSIAVADGTKNIGNYAFENCSSLTDITIPGSMENIGYAAFSGCTRLESVTLPFIGASLNGTSNTYFGYIFGASAAADNASYVPVSLKTVIISGSTSIGSNAFAYCSSLISVTISNSVIAINNSAFYYCTGLTSITISSSVTTIGSYAFQYCSSLISVTIPSSITSLGTYAFANCTGLTSVTILGNVTSFGTYVFSNCTGLTTAIFSEGVTNIGTYTFYYCTSLTSVTIPNGVTTIGTYAFYYCSSLTSIVIPNSVTSLGTYAFQYCTGLASVTIPSNLTSIGSYAFRYCNVLTSVYINNGTISSGLTSLTAQNYLINYATMVYIRSGLTVGSYVANTAYYTPSGTVTVDGTVYNLYTKI